MSTVRPKVREPDSIDSEELIMNIVKVESILAALLKKSDVQQFRENGYVYYHGKRVAGLALQIFTTVKNNCGQEVLDRLYIAALMHDIGKGRKHHAMVGSKMVPKVLGRELDKQEIEDIQRLIREHNLRERPNICELDSKALQDADVLDHFGAQGIWLSVYYTAKNGGDQKDMLRYYRSKEHKDYVEDKFYGLNFDISKKMFNERYAHQKNFLNAIADM